MSKRFVSIWFRYLKTDWYIRRIPGLAQTAFALTLPDHGRKIITAVSAIAERQGVYAGMTEADARAAISSLNVLDDKPGHADTILKGLAEWSIRYTPWVSADVPDGLILDATGCAHLWNGEEQYLLDIAERLKAFGYNIRVAIADTIGCAWAMCRFGQDVNIVESSQQLTALLPMPSHALRLEAETTERLQKLGLRHIRDFIGMPRSALRRRFGQGLLLRIDQALGHEEEILQPVQPPEPYNVRLPCLEPVMTRTGIEIALQTLLENMSSRLAAEGKGLRGCIFKSFRIDGKIEKIETGTNRATHNQKHLFKLFEIKLENIEPGPGIEFFLLEAQKVEDVVIIQEKLWDAASGLENIALAELLDRFNGKFGNGHIHRFLPDEHYWPERSVKAAASITERPAIPWKVDRQRPLQLLEKPEPVEVMAPVPDYPPMNFRYKGKLHKIKSSDGPERIEQEWWLQQGQHRDYYVVEDDEGCRYWLFRSGHYNAAKTYGWFIHGFFA